MPEHHTKDTTGFLAFCSTCNRMTLHRVDNGRKGPCTEPHATGASIKQQKAREKREAEAEQPDLWGSK